MSATHEPQSCIRCAITDLVSRYAHVIDRAGTDAAAELSSLFVEDATFDIAPRPEGSGPSRAWSHGNRPAHGRSTRRGRRAREATAPDVERPGR